MKLLLCGYLDNYGGAQKMLVILANALAQRGHEITLLSLSEGKAKYPISNSVNVIYSTKKSKNKISTVFYHYRMIKNIVKKCTPDLIVTFWLQPAYLCAFAGEKIAGKTIYSERSDPYGKQYSGILGMIRKVAFSKIKGFVFQTEGARDFFDSAIQRRSVIIMNPFNINENDYVRSDKPDKRIVTVGRLHPQKNQKDLINAISKLPKEFDDYIVEIYGEGDLKEELDHYISVLHLENKVFLRGTTNDVLNAIKNAAIFVLTSDYEGIPNALIEAMSLGLPCISTDCRPGGARALISDRINGRIVPCNDPDSLCDAIVEYLINPEFARSCGDEARKIVERTNPDVIFSQWESYFKSIIDAA